MRGKFFDKLWRLVCCVALGAVIGGCQSGSGPIERTPQSKAPDDEIETEEFGASTDDDAGPNGDGTIESVINDCGVHRSDFRDPSYQVLRQQIRSFPRIFTGSKSNLLFGTVATRVAITTELTYEYAPGRGSMLTNFEVDATPTSAESDAREKMNPFRGSFDTRALGYSDHEELINSNSDWEGVYCTMQAVTSVESSIGRDVEVEFDPPVPLLFNPKAEQSRFIAEIGGGRVFKTTATLRGSNESGYNSGDELEGEIRVESAKPIFVLESGDQSFTISGDFAYRITADFGDDEDTAALGIWPEQTYIFDATKKILRGILIDSGDEDMGRFVVAEDL